MEFPSRSGGAQGGLIKGNLFAQSGAPAFSHTKHGDSVIHTVNGRISITRDKQETPQPYLLLPYYGNGRPRLLRTAAEAVVPEIDAPVDQLPAQTITGRGVFVGDGYFLCLERSADGKTSRPILLSIDRPDAPLVGATTPGGSPSPDNVMGANVQLGADWLLDQATVLGEIFPSYVATGWRDKTRRYGFAVFGVLDDGPHSFYASRYACIVGDTGTRTVKTCLLPTLQDSEVPLLRSPPLTGAVSGETPRRAILDYKTSWWGCEVVYAPPDRKSLFDLTDTPGPARCYSVGRGHLIALLTPQERICSYTERFALSSGWEETIGVITPSWLPPGSAQYILRSRDFGETWAMEKADFLVEDDPPSADNFVVQALQEASTPPVGPYPSPYYMENAVIPSALQRVGLCGHFIAAPFGEGRVAVVALGPYQGAIYDDETVSHWDYPWKSTSGRAWCFYTSDKSGAGFTRKSFPMDSMRAEEPMLMVHDGGITPGPGERDFEMPLFNPWGPAPRAYSFAPGHFVWSSIQYRVTGATPGSADFEWGKYPEDYPVTVWVTYDYGETWAPNRMPPGLLRGAQEYLGGTTDLEEYRKVFPRGRWEGSEAWAARSLTFGPLASEDERDKPAFTYMTWQLAGDGVGIYVSDDPGDPVGSLTRVSGLPISPAVSIQDQESLGLAQRSNTHEVFYTGDPRNPQYPELVYPGYPEFEEP